MRKLIVYIEEDQFDAVRRIAYENAASWSAVIRRCIMSYLKLTEIETFEEIKRIERNLINEANGELPEATEHLNEIFEEAKNKFSNTPENIDEIKKDEK